MLETFIPNELVYLICTYLPYAEYLKVTDLNLNPELFLAHLSMKLVSETINSGWGHTLRKRTIDRISFRIDEQEVYRTSEIRFEVTSENFWIHYDTKNRIVYLDQNEDFCKYNKAQPIELTSSLLVQNLDAMSIFWSFKADHEWLWAGINFESIVLDIRYFTWDVSGTAKHKKVKFNFPKA